MGEGAWDGILIRDLEPPRLQRPPPSFTPGGRPPTSPRPFFIHQDRIMWINGPWGGRVATWTPPVEVIRQPPWVVFLHKYFTSLPLCLPLLVLVFSGPSRDHLVFIGQRGVHCAGWVRPGRVRLGRLFSNSGPGESVLRTQGVGVREHAGVERIGRRSAVNKPLPHAPRTAV